MLVELSIRDLALIEELELQLGPGLNAVTGETGAGKSLLVASLELLVGETPKGGAARWVRKGAREARVEGRFELFGRAAIDEVKKQKWYEDCEVWLYRGAWQEWEPERIELAIPISPEELMRKRHAIFKHESQKDKALFPGSDPREFWQRAEDRNKATAKIYDRLGLAEYEAIEAFVKWNGEPVTKLNPVTVKLAATV